MASKLPNMRLTSIASHRTFSSLATRSSTTNTILKSRPSNPLHSSRSQAFLPRPLLQQAFRRSYADAPKVELSPKPKKRFRFFRNLWRVTYLSVLFSVGYTGYLIWDLRNPAEQVDPDPTKKTLVVLGT